VRKPRRRATPSPACKVKADPVYCKYLKRKLFGRHSCTAVTPERKMEREDVESECHVEAKWKECPWYKAKVKKE